MTDACRLRGLYAVTSAEICTRAERLAPAARAALRGGARLLQYRDKINPRARQLELGALLRRLCDEHDALLIVNDHVDLAAAVGADGVHLGAQDPPIADARIRLGSDAVIGAS